MCKSNLEEFGVFKCPEFCVCVFVGVLRMTASI